MVKIVSDSTCDLTKELCARYDIVILPLHVLMGEDDRRDGIDVDQEVLFDWANRAGTTPKTSAPLPEEAEELFRPILDEGHEIVSFSISSSMSASCNVMRMAAESLHAKDRVTVIDSENLSTGIGLLVIEAAIMAKEGKGRDEITARIRELIPFVRSSFIVDTLVYLHRGGRCSGLSALLGSALKLHPRISVADGKMSAGKKYRGQLLKSALDYAHDMEADYRTAKKDRIFITHSAPDEVVQAVYDYLSGLQLFDEVLITHTGGVVSSHCGPGTLGVLFIAGT